MIFLEGDDNKKALLPFLVGAFMVFIIFQWIGHNPIKSITNNESDDAYWAEFDKTFSSTEKLFQANFEQAELELNNLKEEVDQEYKEENLLKSTKEYLENKKNSTTSNATSTE